MSVIVSLTHYCLPNGLRKWNSERCKAVEDGDADLNCRDGVTCPFFVSTQNESSRFLWLWVDGMTSVSGACARDAWRDRGTVE